MNQDTAIRKILSFYKETGLKSLFSKIRFWDAPYFEVEKIIPKSGSIYDLGCGEGFFINFLALTSGKRKLIGIEIDKKRLAIADRSLKNTTFKYGNAITFRPKLADCIILFHVLHHLPSFMDQEKTLKNCFNGLKKNGKLIIVEVDIKPTFKYFLSWVTDHFLVPILFEKRFYSPIYFRKKNDWIDLLKSYGFKVLSKGMEKGKPFSHVVFVCEVR